MSEFPPIRYTGTFVKALAKLPLKIQGDFEKAVSILQNSPADSRLHTKKLKGRFAGVYSVRIGRDYRALFRLLSPRTVEFFDIADRKDIYK